MEKIQLVVAKNLRDLREERRLSLDALKRLSGVSKSMLGQIERGEVNPTISTLWKIALGLKIPFTELIRQPCAEDAVISLTDLQPLLEDGGRYRNYPVFPQEGSRGFEMYYIELDAGGRLDAEAHPAGTREFITVFSGKLAVEVRGEALVAGPGDSVRFRADSPHRYQNVESELCRLSMVIHYPQSF